MKIFLALALCLAAAGAQAREPEVAGKFYPAGGLELSAFVDAALAAADVKKPEGKVIAVVAPHAGYEYSGKVAGYAYKVIADAYDTVVILAAGHRTGVKGAALLASGYYATPFGRVPIDEELSRALIKANPLFGAGQDMFMDDFPMTAHNSFVLAAALVALVVLGSRFPFVRWAPTRERSLALASKAAMIASSPLRPALFTCSSAWITRL